MNGRFAYKILSRLFLLIALFSFIGAISFEIGMRIVSLPRELLNVRRDTTTLVDCRGRILATLASAEAREQRHVSLAEMGRWLPQVTVALEDHRFYEHSGIDFRATLHALVRNLFAGRIVSGGSTITQQLIKLSSGRTRRSWTAKVYENLAAIKLERLWSKDRILEEYLNRSNFANRRIGPAAAALAYFNKAPANLTFPEAVYLAGLPQAPTRFNPWRRKEAADAKYRRSIARLSAVHVETPIALSRADVPPRVTSRRTMPHFAQHFVDAIATRRSNLASGVIQTTLDLALQRYVEELVRLRLASLAPRRANQAAIVILDTRTGDVRAMVGSREYGAAGGQVNGAMTYRSCGSTLKPFLYLQAIENHCLTAATLLPDTPDAVRAEYIDYDPVNYDKRFWGPVRVREALANSLNVPAVVVLSRIGARKVFLGLKDWGLKFQRTFDEYGAGLILGNAEVRLLDITAAYSIFSGHGLAVVPRFLATEPVRHRYIASPEAATILADILSDNVARQKTFGSFSPLAFEGQRVPCKTGTSSGFRDAWTIGVTTEHAVGVWMGNFDGQPMDEVAAVIGPAPLWHEIMEHLLARGDTPVASPVETTRLKRLEVCRLTGLRPAPASPGKIAEWFLAGTEPSENASRYFQQACGTTRLVLPSNYALWCKSSQNHLGAEVEHNERLQIVNPAPNSVFLFDPSISLAQQTLLLRASGNRTQQLVWRVDGRAVFASSVGFLWSLVKGMHIVEVEDGANRAFAEFTVE